MNDFENVIEIKSESIFVNDRQNEQTKKERMKVPSNRFNGSVYPFNSKRYSSSNRSSIRF